MFVNDYLEFKSKARKEIKDVVFKAIEIYKVLEYKKTKIKVGVIVAGILLLFCLTVAYIL